MSTRLSPGASPIGIGLLARQEPTKSGAGCSGMALVRTETSPPARTDEVRWLSINAACKLIGVDQSTLRRWSDSGKVPVVRTPGGHRRYSEEALRALVVESADDGRVNVVSPAEQRDRLLADLPIASARDRRWYRAYSPSMLEEIRCDARRLIELAERFINAEPGAADRASAVGLARQIGEHYGRLSAEAGLTSCEVVESFLYFRIPVLRSVISVADDDGMSARRASRFHVELDQFLDDVLVTTIRSYGHYQASRLEPDRQPPRP